MADEVNLENVKNKVRKLLALGESPNPAEAASAIEKANQILLQYNLEMSEVETKDIMGVVEENFMEGFAEREHETGLIAAIASYNLCKAFRNNKTVYGSINRKTKFTLKFIGKKHNIVAAKLMCEYAFQALESSAKKQVKGAGRTAVFSYKVGYCNELTNRLHQMVEERKQKVTVECTALVVVETAEVNQFIKDNYKNATVSQLKTPNVKDITAFFAGQLAARNLGLNQQVQG